MVSLVQGMPGLIFWSYARVISIQAARMKLHRTILKDYNDETDRQLEEMPKTSNAEAVLLLGHLSKIFAYDPLARITAAEMLDHPWFHTDFDD
jgi:hypothetical protein